MNGQGGISASQLGLVVGLFLGSWHTVWSVLVLLGWGQAVICRAGKS
jgi:hypothetical protein